MIRIIINMVLSRIMVLSCISVRNVVIFYIQQIYTNQEKQISVRHVMRVC